MAPWGSTDVLDWLAFAVVLVVLAVVLPVLFAWSFLDEARDAVGRRFHGA